jgi:hypothetical protein
MEHFVAKNGERIEYFAGSDDLCVLALPLAFRIALTERGDS